MPGSWCGASMRACVKSARWACACIFTLTLLLLLYCPHLVCCFPFWDPIHSNIVQRGRIPASFGQTKPARAAGVVCGVPAAMHETHAKQRDIRDYANKAYTTAVLPVYQATRNVTPPPLGEYRYVSSKLIFSTSGRAHAPSDASIDQSQRYISGATVAVVRTLVSWRKSTSEFCPGGCAVLRGIRCYCCTVYDVQKHRNIYLFVVGLIFRSLNNACLKRSALNPWILHYSSTIVTPVHSTSLGVLNTEDPPVATWRRHTRRVERIYIHINMYSLVIKRRNPREESPTGTWMIQATAFKDRPIATTTTITNSRNKKHRQMLTEG